MNDNVILTESIKIDISRHCIGMDYEKTYHRHGKAFYRPYRNYYVLWKRDPHWESLVEEGYARCETTSQGNVIYSMTRKGLDWLGKRLGVTIHDEED